MSDPKAVPAPISTPAKSPLTPPQSSTADEVADTGKRLVRAAAGAVPVAGPLLAEIADKLIRLPLERRRAAWERDVAAALEEVLARRTDLDMDALGRDESFVTTVHRATDIAMRTHLEAKREALRNAVVNAALPSAPPEERQAEFLRFVEILTPTQLRLLRLFDDPRAFFQSHGLKMPDFHAAGRDALVPLAFPDLAGQEELWRRGGKQLEELGLMAGLGGLMSGHGIWERATSALGRAFLEFISVPPSA